MLASGAPEGCTLHFIQADNEITLTYMTPVLVEVTTAEEIAYDGDPVEPGTDFTVRIYLYEDHQKGEEITGNYAVGGGSIGVSYRYRPADSTGAYTAGLPTEAGSYTVMVTIVADNLNYYSSASASFPLTIEPRTITDAVLNMGTQNVYNGTEQSAVIESVTQDGKTLTAGTDYTILSGDTATNVETTSLTIRGTGNYTGEVTADWSLQKAVPTRADFIIPAIPTMPYTGQASALATPSLRSPKHGAGAITILYNGDTAVPVNAGSYSVTFRVAEGRNFAASGELTYGTLNIYKTRFPLSVSPAGLYRGGNTVDLKDYITCPDETGTMIFSISGDSLGCTVTPEGIFTSGNTVGTVNVTVTVPENANHLRTTESLRVTIREKDDAGVSINPSGTLTKSYGNRPFKLTASVTNPGTDGGWTWASDDESVATVDSTGRVTLTGIGTTVLTARYESNSTAGEASLTLTVKGEIDLSGTSVSDTTLHYSFILPGSEKTFFLLAAWYDSQGRMTGLENRSVTGCEEISGEITVEENQDSYKLFLIDSKGIPLCRNWCSD